MWVLGRFFFMKLELVYILKFNLVVRLGEVFEYGNDFRVVFGKLILRIVGGVDVYGGWRDYRGFGGFFNIVIYRF